VEPEPRHDKDHPVDHQPLDDERNILNAADHPVAVDLLAVHAVLVIDEPDDMQAPVRMELDGTNKIARPLAGADNEQVLPVVTAAVDAVEEEQQQLPLQQK